MFWLKICVIACDLHLEIVYSAGFCETVYYRVTHNNWRHFLLDVSISFLLSLNNFLKIISYLVLYLVHWSQDSRKGVSLSRFRGYWGCFPSLRLMLSIRTCQMDMGLADLETCGRIMPLRFLWFHVFSATLFIEFRSMIFDSYSCLEIMQSVIWGLRISV